MKLDTESFSALIKLIIFLIFTGLATVLLAILLTNGSFAARTEYKAVFEDATGVVKGDDVRIAGVVVGSVRSIEVIDRTKAVAVFEVDEDVPLTENTNVQVRFRNLIGQRYFNLTQGSDGAQERLEAGATIPASRTKEALDLNMLFNGFKPVFEGLSPDDTNKFAFEIVQSLQGESGTVEQLLARTSSLTNTLAERDQLIGDVITNLSETLRFVGARDQELGRTIDTLQQFTTGFKNDRNAILGSIDSVSDLAVVTADLLVDARPPIKDDIAALRTLTNDSNKGLSNPQRKEELADAIQILPIKMSKIGNGATYGSAFNFYVCELNVNVDLTDEFLEGLPPELAGLTGLGSATGTNDADRCEPGTLRGDG